LVVVDVVATAAPPRGARKPVQRVSRRPANFYPIPYRQEPQKDGSLHIVRVEPNPLPKAELIKLYRNCGEVLHRGRKPDKPDN